MSARGYIGLGTKLEYSDDDGTTWVEIARITEIPELSFGDVDQVDVTGYDTPTRVRESIAGMADAADLEITGIFTADDSQMDLEELHGTGAVVEWRATLAEDIAQVTFDAYVSDFSINPQLEDRIEFSATLQTTGRPEIVAPAPE